jgi:hypothetical protein
MQNEKQDYDRLQKIVEIVAVCPYCLSNTSIAKKDSDRFIRYYCHEEHPPILYDSYTHLMLFC